MEQSHKKLVYNKSSSILPANMAKYSNKAVTYAAQIIKVLLRYNSQL